MKVLKYHAMLDDTISQIFEDESVYHPRTMTDGIVYTTIKEDLSECVTSTINIPSYICKVGDVIAVRESKKTNRAVVDALEANKNMAVPSWIDYNKDKMEAKIVRTPVRDDLDFEVQESLIVELYSRN